MKPIIEEIAFVVIHGMKHLYPDVKL